MIFCMDVSGDLTGKDLNSYSEVVAILKLKPVFSLPNLIDICKKMKS